MTIAIPDAATTTANGGVYNDFDALVYWAGMFGLQVSVWTKVQEATDFSPRIATREAAFVTPEGLGPDLRTIRITSVQVGTLPERLRECTVHRDGRTEVHTPDTGFYSLAIDLINLSNTTREN